MKRISSSKKWKHSRKNSFCGDLKSQGVEVSVENWQSLISLDHMSLNYSYLWDLICPSDAQFDYCIQQQFLKYMFKAYKLKNSIHKQYNGYQKNFFQPKGHSKDFRSKGLQYNVKLTLFQYV